MGKLWQRPESGESVVVAAADIAPAALEEFKNWAQPRAFLTTDYRELLRRDDIDAVAVFSPDYLHEEHATAVLNAGKHLFLEKPMAISTEGCDRILRAWRKSGAKFMIGFNMRYMPVIVKAKQLLDAGAIGDLKAVWVRHFVGAGGDFYYHDWHALRKNTAGLLLQKASHDIDVIHWLAGAYTQRVAAFGSQDYFGGDKPNALTCPKRNENKTCPEVQLPDNPRQQCAFREEIDVEDNQIVILELGNGVKASYAQCHFTPEYLRNYTLIGTTGRIEMEVEQNRIWTVARPNGQAWTANPIRTEHALDGIEGWHGGGDKIIAEAFLDMVLRDVEPRSHPLAGRMSVAVGCEATRSLREGDMRIVPQPEPLERKPADFQPATQSWPHVQPSRPPARV